MSAEYAPLWLAELVAKGLTCRTCHGSGVVTVTLMMDEGGSAAGVPCSDCNNTGKRVWPQDQWPQMVWGWTEADPKPRFLYSARGFIYEFAVTCVAAPVVLTFDGGGLLPWLADVLDYVYEYTQAGWSAEQLRPRKVPVVPLYGATPLALTEAMLKAEGIKHE